MHEQSLAAGAARQTPSRLRRELFYSLLPNHLVAPRHLRSRAFSIASAPAALRSLVLPHQLYNRHAATDDICCYVMNFGDVYIEFNDFVNRRNCRRSQQVLTQNIKFKTTTSFVGFVNPFISVIA